MTIKVSYPLYIPSPGAGQPTSFDIPKIGTLESVNFEVVTSAAVANRLVVISVQDGSGNTLFEVPGDSVQAAGTNYFYTAFVNGAYKTIAGNLASYETMPLPEVTVQNGWTLTIGINNQQAGDTIEPAVAFLSKAD